MGLLGDLFGDGSKEFEEALNSLPGVDEMWEWSEPKYRNALQAHLLKVLDGADVKREAGVQGAGTNLDLWCQYKKHDYLITIKKGVSQQKLKKVLGEISIMLTRWRATVHGRRTYVFYCIYGWPDDAEIEAHIMEFGRVTGPQCNQYFTIKPMIPGLHGLTKKDNPAPKA
jgi:hypothetical protein